MTIKSEQQQQKIFFAQKRKGWVKSQTFFWQGGGIKYALGVRKGEGITGVKGGVGV
jgi:hypothetical protein